ncbi:hypothetical protein GCM10010193_22470 [Kitasatospora atroaurantiaca]|uniref:Uncharacterized protein n=1 Tax=Kitasatospora atroaurantiaca TaxID=285545 RepID=A0A561EUR7_9ACTN|nr:hypothetical protein [Kitasatospora atroaurantiaca]TWE19362.1 hypothetical protein FB465_4478 [Kitasatospora atroaurantiaca]
MLIESIAFVLIGLAVGVGAVVLLPGYFPAARSLTVSTALVAAVLGGLISGYALDGRLPGVSLAVSAVSSVLLVSVLARPGQVTRQGRHRHRHA